MRRGLVDEFELFVAPAVIGGGTPFFPPDVQIDLELVETRNFDGTVYLRYRRRGQLMDRLLTRRSYATWAAVPPELGLAVYAQVALVVGGASRHFSHRPVVVRASWSLGVQVAEFDVEMSPSGGRDPPATAVLERADLADHSTPSRDGTSKVVAGLQVVIGDVADRIAAVPELNLHPVATVRGAAGRDTAIGDVSRYLVVVGSVLGSGVDPGRGARRSVIVEGDLVSTVCPRTGFIAIEPRVRSADPYRSLGHCRNSRLLGCGEQAYGKDRREPAS
jgi:hypothetical protein